MKRIIVVAITVLALAGASLMVEAKPDGRGWAKRWTCADSDSGLDFSVAGSVVWWNHTFSDRCVGNSTLKEYYCVGNHFWHVSKRCNCVNGACVGGTCKQGFVNATCEGNQSARLFVYRNCTQEWRTAECEFGCNAGKCSQSPEPGCHAGPLENRTCDGNWSVRLHMNGSCMEEWRNVTLCENGCMDGSCIEAHKECLPRYTDTYRCDGNWTFRMYRNANCSEKWMRGHFCRYGCVDGRCNPAS